MSQVTCSKQLIEPASPGGGVPYRSHTVQPYKNQAVQQEGATDHLQYTINSTNHQAGATRHPQNLHRTQLIEPANRRVLQVTITLSAVNYIMLYYNH